MCIRRTFINPTTGNRSSLLRQGIVPFFDMLPILVRIFALRQVPSVRRFVIWFVRRSVCNRLVRIGLAALVMVRATVIIVRLSGKKQTQTRDISMQTWSPGHSVKVQVYRLWPYGPETMKGQTHDMDKDRSSTDELEVRGQEYISSVKSCHKFWVSGPLCSSYLTTRFIFSDWSSDN